MSRRYKQPAYIYLPIVSSNIFIDNEDFIIIPVPSTTPFWKVFLLSSADDKISVLDNYVN